MKNIHSRNPGRGTLNRPLFSHRFRALFMALLLLCPFAARHASASEFYQADITPLLDAAQSRCDQGGEYAALTYRGCADAVRDMREKLQEQTLYKNRDACMKAFASLLERRDSLLRNQENWCAGQFANPHDRRGCLDAAQALFSDFPGERYCPVPTNAAAPQNRSSAGYPLQAAGSAAPVSVMSDTPKPGRYPGSSAGFTGRTPSGNYDMTARELFAAPPGQTPIIDTPKPGRMPGAARPAAKQRQTKSTSAPTAEAQKKPRQVSEQTATDAQTGLPAAQYAPASRTKEQPGAATPQLKAAQAQTALQPRPPADRAAETAGQGTMGAPAPTAETATPARAEGGAPAVESQPAPMSRTGALVQPSVKPEIRQPASAEAVKSPVADSPASEGSEAERLQNAQTAIEHQEKHEQQDQQEKNPAAALTASERRKPGEQDTGSSTALNQPQAPASATEPNDGGDPVSALIGTIMEQDEAANETAASAKEAESPLSQDSIAESGSRPRDKGVQEAQTQASDSGANAGATGAQQEDAPDFPAFTLPQPQQSQTASALQQPVTTQPRAQDGTLLPLPAGMLAVDREMERASTQTPSVTASPPTR